MLVIGCKNKKIFKGFTLIELLVVLLIIGISTTLITLSFNTVSSIEKQTNSVEEYSRFLAEESIVSGCLLYTSPSPRDRQKSRMPSSA